MKKSTLFAAAAVLAFASPLAVTASLAQTPQHNGQAAPYQGPSQRAQDRDQRNEEAREPNQDERSDARNHRDNREEWRDDRRDARWDETRHNGYYVNGRWTYGEPSTQSYGRAGFALGYRPWTVGQNIGVFNGRFQNVDYRRQQLRPPPRGLHWVRDDRGDYLLINRSGRIMQIVVSGNQPRDRRQSWRDSRDNARWDDARHNGYYSNNQWTFGPPPQGRRDVVYGYQPWQRGERLGYYDGRYSEVDYRSNPRMRAPPRGYHWVRSDGGDLLLAAIVGGLITQVILNGSR